MKGPFGTKKSWKNGPDMVQLVYCIRAVSYEKYQRYAEEKCIGKREADMEFRIRRKTCSGMEEYRLTGEKVGTLETECIQHFDPRIADLVCLFLEEECAAEGIAAPEELVGREHDRNWADGKALHGYRATPEHGAQLTTTQIKSIFHFIWKSYLFQESTGMDFRMLQLFHKVETTDDPDELLFWSFRFCAWGGYDNPLPYTLYRCLVDGRLKRFYNGYPEWQSEFLCMDAAEKS